ncbi:hypothetical protein [Jeotgalicoccus marinus]|uniref:hypothetical protein n=1 Tax=Jeotgalicoccus marinus TaxID=516700 RepID=UPI00040D1F6F|nr:hypothetical protein [Jeotgalicoccus marinus]
MHILLFVLVAGLLIKFATTSFFDQDRIHFSFDERRYFNDEKETIAKIMRLNLVKKERIFFIVMTLVYITSIILYFSGNITLGLSALVLVIILQLLLNIMTDFLLYTAFYDKANLFMIAIWLVLIAAVIILSNMYII